MDLKSFDLQEDLEIYKTHLFRMISIGERLEETLDKIRGIVPVQDLALLAVTSNKLVSIWEEASETINICSDDLRNILNKEEIKVQELKVMNGEIIEKLTDLRDRYNRIYGKKGE
jgi:hypothetical protein